MKVSESFVNSLADYPLSWTYAISLTAFQPLLNEFIPILNQVLVLFLIHLVTIFVDWLRQKLDVPKNRKDSMDMLGELDDIISRRKDVEKEKKNSEN